MLMFVKIFMKRSLFLRFKRGWVVQPGVGWLGLMVLGAGMGLGLCGVRSDEAPVISGIAVGNGQKVIRFQPFPAAQEYRILSSPTASGPYAADGSGTVSGVNWAAPLTTPIGFYRLQVTQLSSNEVWTANALNRLAYGPSPDDLDWVRSVGPQAWVAQQLAPESIVESLPFDTVSAPGSTNGWQYVTVTGTGSSSKLYIYLNVAGEGWIDDVRLVAGTVAGVGANLLRNGDFESPLNTNDWAVAANHIQSAVVTDVAKSGGSSLHLVASSGGTTESSAIVQTITPDLSTTAKYTLSYWYLPSTNKLSSVTVRLSGSGVTSTPLPLPSLLTRLEYTSASIDDLRAWHIQRAIRSKRQLLEVLLQFLENHFVTEYSKSYDFINRYLNDGTQIGQIAASFEYKENRRWRQALLNPQCTFLDLLRVSAESPAMIIYLDTVDSKGNGSNIANENYARELLELFTFGVDNGYDQNDIVVLSRAWTGWAVNIVDATNEFNPFVKRTTNHPTGTANAVTNLIGVWAFNYNPDVHNNTAKTIFPGKKVPDRFGPPYAGRSYEITLPVRAGTNGATNGINDGYEILAHLANQPFTQEFISVKLCRLFVGDNFATGYDFTDPGLTAEGRLVRDCMAAWESSNPKGQIRPVLATIFNSDLFRSSRSSMQKVKTPLEFLASAVRALSSGKADGTNTATTDGAFSAALNRMGAMKLFDRDTPDGYPEAAAPWISAGTLAERLRWVQNFLMPVSARGGVGDVSAATYADPVGLLRLRVPADRLADPTAVADYFIGTLYPAEGKANLDVYRSIALQFLNSGDDGKSASAFSSLAVSSAAYDTRVRGMVAMLMTLPRFHEQ